MKVITNHEQALTIARQHGNMMMRRNGRMEWNKSDFHVAVNAYYESIIIEDEKPKPIYTARVIPDEDEFEPEQLEKKYVSQAERNYQEALREANQHLDDLFLKEYYNATFDSQQRKDHQRREAGMANSNPVSSESFPDEWQVQNEHLSKSISSMLEILLGKRRA